MFSYDIMFKMKLQNTHVLRDFQRKKAERRRYLALQQERYVKQKEEGEVDQQQHDIDVPDEVVSKNYEIDSHDAVSTSSKIKVHRKRSHHSESSENQHSVINGTEITPKEAEKLQTLKEKKNGNNSVPDLVSVGEEVETSSPEKVKGPIARKLTFGHEVMDTPTKGKRTSIQ